MFLLDYITNCTLSHRSTEENLILLVLWFLYIVLICASHLKLWLVSWWNRNNPHTNKQSKIMFNKFRFFSVSYTIFITLGRNILADLDSMDTYKVCSNILFLIISVYKSCPMQCNFRNPNTLWTKKRPDLRSMFWICT